MLTYTAPAIIAHDPITARFVQAMRDEPLVTCKHRVGALGAVFYPQITAMLAVAAEMVQPDGYGFACVHHTGPYFAGTAALENFARGGLYLGNMAALENWLANGGARAQLMAVQQVTGALYTGWPVSHAFPLDLTPALLRVAGNLYAINHVA